MTTKINYVSICLTNNISKVFIMRYELNNIKNELKTKFADMIDSMDFEIKQNEIKPDDNSRIKGKFVTSVDIDIDNLQLYKFKVGDYIEIPVDGELIRFDVKHVTSERTYFVSHDIVGQSSMDDMNKFLDDYLAKMPTKLVDQMYGQEHIYEYDDFHYDTFRKLTIPSLGNFTGSDRCLGYDDIQFDGFKTEADRCKNNSRGETDYYWTDSPYASYSTDFVGVHYNGGPNYAINAGNTFGVVLCFAI